MTSPDRKPSRKKSKQDIARAISAPYSDIGVYKPLLAMSKPQLKLLATSCSVAKSGNKQQLADRIEPILDARLKKYNKAKKERLNRLSMVSGNNFLNEAKKYGVVISPQTVESVQRKNVSAKTLHNLGCDQHWDLRDMFKMDYNTYRHFCEFSIAVAKGAVEVNLVPFVELKEQLAQDAQNENELNLNQNQNQNEMNELNNMNLNELNQNENQNSNNFAENPAMTGSGGRFGGGGGRFGGGGSRIISGGGSRIISSGFCDLSGGGGIGGISGGGSRIISGAFGDLSGGGSRIETLEDVNEDAPDWKRMLGVAMDTLLCLPPVKYRATHENRPARQALVGPTRVSEFKKYKKIKEKAKLNQILKILVPTGYCSLSKTPPPESQLLPEQKELENDGNGIIMIENESNANNEIRSEEIGNGNGNENEKENEKENVNENENENENKIKKRNKKQRSKKMSETEKKVRNARKGGHSSFFITINDFGSVYIAKDDQGKAKMMEVQTDYKLNCANSLLVHYGQEAVDNAYDCGFLVGYQPPAPQNDDENDAQIKQMDLLSELGIM